MRKIKVLLVVLVMIFSAILFSSCGSKSKTTSESKSESTSSQVEFSADIKSIYEGLISLSKTNSFKFYPNTIEKNDATTDSSEYYTFNINYKDNSTDADSIFHILLSPNEKSMCIIKNINAVSDADFNISLKDLLTAIIMYTNKSLDLSSAKNLMQDLVNSYSGSGYSKLLSNGDYSILITPYPVNDMAIDVTHKDEIFEKINKSEYPLIDYPTAGSPINVGTKYYVKGKVMDVIHSLDLLEDDCIYIITEDNKIMTINFRYFSSPVEVIKGSSYVFYGKVGKNTNAESPKLDLQLMENYN